MIRQIILSRALKCVVFAHEIYECAERAGAFGDGWDKIGTTPENVRTSLPKDGPNGLVGSTHSLAIIVGSPDSRAFGIHIAVQINPAPTARGTIGHNQMLKSDQL